MNMDCREIELRELLPEYAHGRADAETHARVSAHVAGCAQCAHELEIIRAARASYSRVRVPDVARIAAALPAPPARPVLGIERGGLPARASRGRWPRQVSAFRIAAGIAAIAVGGAGLKIASDGRQAASGAINPPPAVAEAPVAAPAPREAVPEVASGGGRGGSAGTTATVGASGAPSRGMTFGGGVSDLTDADLAALLAAIDQIDPVPAAEPESETSTMGIEEG